LPRLTTVPLPTENLFDWSHAVNILLFVIVVVIIKLIYVKISGDFKATIKLSPESLYPIPALDWREWLAFCVVFFNSCFILSGRKMSIEALIQFVTEFPILYDTRKADYKDNNKKKRGEIWDGTDVTNPFRSPFLP
jgi:hypothetical protein